MQEIIIAGVSAAAGGGLSGFIIRELVKNYLSGLTLEREQLETKLNALTSALEHLKTERIAKLENKIEGHVDEDKTDRILTIVESTSSRLAIYENTQLRHSTDIATLQANDKSQNLYIENLDKSFQRHKQEKH